MAPKMKKPENELKLGAGFPPSSSDWIDVSKSPGANWWTIADQISQKTGVNISAEELVTHNFKLKRGETDYEAKVNYYLHHLIGCKIPADGKPISFEGATIGKIYYPKVVVGDGPHVIIIGGVSVNEPTHDKYPFNFIELALRRGEGYGKNVHYIFFAPSYEARVKHQKNEYKWMLWNTRPTDGCEKGSLWHAWQHAPDPTKWEKDPEHFLIYTRSKAKSHDAKVTAILTADELTKVLNGIDKIASVDYYGHSTATAIYLDFGIDGTFNSKQQWTRKQAGQVAASRFLRSATFSSFGCKQGQDDGLAPALRDLWKIRTIGAEGKTDYTALSKDKTTMFPDAAGGYYLFSPPVGKQPTKKKPIEKKDLAGSSQPAQAGQ